jgi:hypothetical protein
MKTFKVNCYVDGLYHIVLEENDIPYKKCDLIWVYSPWVLRWDVSEKSFKRNIKSKNLCSKCFDFQTMVRIAAAREAYQNA